MSYRHKWTSGSVISLPVGKVVCVGRNYAEHAREMNNTVPAEPLLFIKPPSSIVEIETPVAIPRNRGAVHFEAEISILIGEELRDVDAARARSGIAGIGAALDLTLRDVQEELKKCGHPWEKAKAFDGACPMSAFGPVGSFDSLDDIGIQLVVNGNVRQKGLSSQMTTGIVPLIEYISTWFTLYPGDVVLTGTPAGVGELQVGDEFEIGLPGHLTARSRITAS